MMLWTTAEKRSTLSYSAKAEVSAQQTLKIQIHKHTLLPLSVIKPHNLFDCGINGFVDFKHGNSMVLQYFSRLTSDIAAQEKAAILNDPELDSTFDS